MKSEISLCRPDVACYRHAVSRTRRQRAAAVGFGGSMAAPRWLPWAALLAGSAVDALYSVQMYRQPADAVAGMPFGSQPTVVLYDDSGMLASTFDGSCYAEVYTSPTGQEGVFRNGSSEVADLRIPFVDGYAVFDGLYIDVTGEYTLQMIVFGLKTQRTKTLRRNKLLDS